MDLEKAGASSQEERIAFIKKLLDNLDLKRMTLLGDREYVGEQWLKSLVNHSTCFDD